MEQAGDNNGNLDNTHTAEIASPRAKSVVQSLRHSLPALGRRGSDSTSSITPSKLLQQEVHQSEGGSLDHDVQKETAAGAPQLSNASEGGAKGGGRSSVEAGGGGRGSRSAGEGTTDAAAVAAVAAAAAELSAAALATTGPAAAETSDGASLGTQAEEHLSCKYTKAELLSRHYGMNLLQMKRVKALLRMGVCEEDLEIADRLLKMGRDISNDTPLTKEEQLLGYTSQQRQRIKALQILGLTEESFDRCRAVMLSSLGPSAFGYNADETAQSAARTVAEEGWTPGDKFGRKGPGHHFGGGGDGGLLKMPTFGHSHHPHPGLGVHGSTTKIGDMGGSGRIKRSTKVFQPTRRASDSDKGDYLPDIAMNKRKGRGAGGGAVAVAMPPLETIVGSRVDSPPGIASPLSTSSDPR